MASYKGRFKPKYPEKYKGNPTNIIYRSLWELRVMRYFDQHPGVIEWGSEEIIIPYISPVDNKIHRYFPDFYVKMRNRTGTLETMILEVKPSGQTKEPVKQDKVSRRYIKEVFTYGINQAKWKAAEEFCKDRKWIFKVLTEKELGIKN